jgi:hypothetical protein
MACPYITDPRRSSQTAPHGGVEGCALDSNLGRQLVLRFEPLRRAHPECGGRLYSQIGLAQSIELARCRTCDGRSRRVHTRRLSIVIALPRESPPPGGFSLDRFGTRPWTARWRRDLRPPPHDSRHTIETGQNPSPLSSSLSCPAPPVSTRHLHPTALQDERPPSPELLLAALSQCAGFQVLGRPWPSAGNHPGTHTPSPIRGDLPKSRHVARGLSPSGLAPHVPSSRSVAVAEVGRADFAFRGQNTEAPPLPIGAGSSPFGTVS